MVSIRSGLLNKKLEMIKLIKQERRIKSIEFYHKLRLNLLCQAYSA
jgi:hypothetical protein